jgi:pimeloyl-ACP methyl ester carboxylesterase
VPVPRPSSETLTRGRHVYRRRQHPTPDYTLGVYEYLAPGSLRRPAAAFVHGLEEGWEVWEALAVRLSPRLRTFCLDLPWSGRNRYRWTHSSSARGWIARGLELMPRPLSVAVAHSFGVNALLEHLHVRGPRSLDAAVLVSPFYRGRQELPWPLFYHYMDNFQRFLEAGVQVRRSPRRVASEPDSVLARKVFDRMGPVGCLQFLNIFARTPRLDLGRLKFPVLIVGGEEDFYSLPADCEELRRALPRAETHLLPRCGHFGMIEQPETLSRLIEEFLDRSLGPGPRGRQEDRQCALT